ncbi:MAG: tetratricopeptide repeat protein [Spirochaetota bacterium]
MKRYIVYTLCMASILLYHCSSVQHSKHKNLWRFNDPYINQTIVNAWENVYKRRYEWAALDFIRLIQKNYIDYDILFGAGLAYYFMNDNTKALDYFTQTIEKNHNHFEAYYFRAKLFLSQGEKVKAKRDLEIIVNINYDKPLLCGYYFNKEDIADIHILKSRQKEAQSLIVAIDHDR